MSVTPPVAHVEMWPYVVSAAVASASHVATAVLMLLSVMTLFVCCTGRGVGCGTGRGVGAGAAPLDVATVGRRDGFDVDRGVGSDVGLDVGFGTGRGVGADVQPPCTMPHDVDAHRVLVNAHSRSTPTPTHQPRSWLKAEAT